MKVVLVLFILLHGQPEPYQEGAEVADIKECLVQAEKLLHHPRPKNVKLYQVSCVIVDDGVRA